MDELVDIVDMSDNILYQKMKSQVHSDILIHRTVHGVVINYKNEIFLVRRSMTREKGPGLYDASIGGHVLAGETYEQAIIREGNEELGIKNGEYKFVTKYLSDHPRMKHMCGVFVIVYEGDIILDLREFDQGERLVYSDIISMPEYLFTPDYLITLQKLKNMFDTK